MRDFTSTLLSASASDVTTLGWLMSIEPIADAAVYFTSFGADAVVGGHSYLGKPGFDMGDIRFSDTDPPAVEVVMPIDSGTPLTFDWAARRKADQARVRIYLIDWSTNSYVEIGCRWYVGAVTALDSGQATFDVRAMERAQRNLMLDVVGPTCKDKFGDSRCGVDVVSLWQDSVTVASYTDAFTFTVTGMRTAAVDDSYAYGAIKFTSGENSGYAYEIRRSVKSSGQVSLWAPLRSPVAIGDTAVMHFGCDGSLSRCQFFSNSPRRQAQEDLPVGDLTFDVNDTRTWA